MVFIPSASPLTSGAYTLRDAAKLLRLPLPRLRTWTTGRAKPAPSEDAEREFPAGKMKTRGTARERHFDFYTLVELYTLARLREYGVSMRVIREARAELAQREKTTYPFALRGLLTDRKKLLFNLGEKALLELGTQGQTSFEQVMEPFCVRLDFDDESHLACRFHPVGRESPIVVDPSRAFGRPIIAGTSIATENLAALIRGGENIEDVANDFGLDTVVVAEVWRFENLMNHDA